MLINKADPANTPLIKPLVVGEDLRPWYQENEGRWLICLPSGWTEQTFPELCSLESLAWERITRQYPGLAAYLETESVEETARKHSNPGDFWWEWGKGVSTHTNLSPIFLLDDATREYITAHDSNCATFIQPLPDKKNQSQTQQENDKHWLLTIPYGWTLDTFPEITLRETIAWEKFTGRYPALTAYLEPFAKAARKRQDKGQYWWELRPCNYYNAFEQPKIFWADMAKYPRFSWDEKGYFSNDTCFFLMSTDLSLLGILQSRITWFCISYRCAHLAERENLIIYRHKTQYMKKLPIPSLTEDQRSHISSLARQFSDKAQQRYDVRRAMIQRMKSDMGAGQGKLTDRLEEWWTLSWQAFRDETYKSFKRDIPLRERGDWETLQREQSAQIEQYTAEICKLEEELNTAVYSVFGLNDEEIKIIEQETKYQYSEW